MKNKRRKKGILLIVTGLLLIAAALVLVWYNLRTENVAGNASDQIAQELSARIGEKSVSDEGQWVFVPYEENGKAVIIDGQSGRWVRIHGWSELNPETDADEGQWVFVPYSNNREVTEFSEATGEWVLIPKPAIENGETTELMILEPDEQRSDPPDYMLNPNMDMPETKIDGNSYIGILQIPALNLKLPVMGEWNYPKLRIAPCRYAGSAYQDNMIICGHNYDRHFGRLKTLKVGTEISFTDSNGNVFRYKVVELETLKPRAIEQMKSGDWDLTLFTCTIGGATRVTVRCERL